MPRETEYLLYRKGSNASNQPCTFDWVPIAIVRAASRAEAEETTRGDETPNVHGCPTVAAEVVAQVDRLDVWSNQYLKAVPRSKARKSDWNSVLENDAREDISREDAELDAEFAYYKKLALDDDDDVFVVAEVVEEGL